MNASPARNFQHIMEEMGPAPANTVRNNKFIMTSPTGPIETGGPWNRSHSQLRSS